MADETVCTVSSTDDEKNKAEKEHVGTITTTIRATSEGVSSSVDFDGDFSKYSVLAGIATTIFHTSKVINVPLEQTITIIINALANIQGALNENDSTAGE